MRKIQLLIACISLGFGLIAQPIELNENSWFRNGPNGAYVTSMDFAPSNPDVMYLGTIANGVYKTTNGGASWDLCNREGLLNLPEEYSSTYGPEAALARYGDYEPVELIKVDPENPEIVWAAFHYNGVYKSIDGCNNWEKQGEGIIDDVWITAIDINPNDPDDILIAGDTLYHTIDGGQSWTIIDQIPGGEGRNISRIFRFPTNNDHILVCATNTEESGVYESLDNGDSWNLISGMVLYSLVSDQQTNRLWAIQGTGSNSLLYSVDGGANWEVETNELFSNSRSEDVFVDGEKIFVVVKDDCWRYINWLVMSNDHGETWSEYGCLYTLSNLEYFSRGYSNKSVVIPSKSGEFYVGGISGLQRLDQTVDDFVPANTNLMNTHVNTVACSPLDTYIIYAGSKQGLFKSTDGGVSWSVINLFPDLKTALNPFNEQVLFAYNDTIFKTINGGQTFETISFDYGYDLYDVKYHPTEPNVVFLLCSNGIYKSLDQGENWGLMSDEIYCNGSSRIVFDISHPDTMYCGFNVTYDGGETWNLFSNYHEVKIVHPTECNILFATSLHSNGLFKSEDYGETFITISDTTVSASNIVIDKSNPDYIFSSGHSVLKYSPDCGDTWYDIECSFDGGVRQIIPNVEENRFIVATHGDGVWVYDESINDIEEFSSAGQATNQIHVYPNPFTERVNISFIVHERSNVKVDVFDANGKQIATLFNGTVTPGQQEITWSRREGDAYAGVYFIRVKYNENIQYQKVIYY